MGLCSNANSLSVVSIKTILLMASKRPTPLIQLKSPGTFLLASVKQEPLQSPPSLPPPDSIPISQPLTVVKTEPEQPSPPQQQPHEEERGKEPNLLTSIDDLFSISSAIDVFKCKLQELTEHFDYINQAIDSKLNEPQEKQLPRVEARPHPKLAETDDKTAKRLSQWVPPLKSSRPEIEIFCESMCSKGLRKYIVANLINISKLREEVPAALKLAPKPAKLILDCIGRFYLQGIKAYLKDSAMIPARQASVLVLEFFLLMMGSSRGKDEANIPADVKREAEQAAIAWRKRLILEGGLSKTGEVDARGLLLFVASFGIPSSFLPEDLGILLRLCNLRAISDALKGSPLLTAKMPEIIEGMSKNGKYAEAIEVASIFGLEDKFSCKTILTLFLEESTKAFKRARQEAQHAQHSPRALRNVTEKQLDALKPLVHYLEDCSNDAKSLVGEWHIEEKIVELEEEIADLQKRIGNKKFTKKRKLNKMQSSSNIKNQEMKHPRLAVRGSPLLKSSHINGLHEQWTATLADGTRSYNGLVPNSMDGGIYGHASNYPAASSLPHESAVGSFPENGGGSCSMITNTVIGVDKAEQITSSSGLPCGLMQSSAGQSASMRYGNLFGSSPSVEGFKGLPKLPCSGLTDSTAVNLYAFVDSVGESESFSNSSHRNGTMYSTYMYLKK